MTTQPIKQTGAEADEESIFLVTDPENAAQAIPENTRRRPTYHQEEVVGRTAHGYPRHVLVDNNGATVLSEAALATGVMGAILQELRLLRRDVGALRELVYIGTSEAVGYDAQFGADRRTGEE